MGKVDPSTITSQIEIDLEVITTVLADGAHVLNWTAKCLACEGMLIGQDVVPPGFQGSLQIGGRLRHEHDCPAQAAVIDEIRQRENPN